MQQEEASKVGATGIQEAKLPGESDGTEITQNIKYTRLEKNHPTNLAYMT
jgi:hypothetical protein